MIALLIDADNFSAPAWVEQAVRTIERNGGPIAIRRAYGSADNLKGLSEVLRTRAIRPFVNLPLAKNTTDISLAIDAMELACSTPRPKMVVIASGDLDFVPLVVRLRERGIRVVCASERGKLAQDAIPAYDEIIYVGADQVVSPAPNSPEPKRVAAAPAPQKSTPKAPAAKPVVAKPAAKKSVKPAAKKAKPQAAKPKLAPTPTLIIAALPNLKAGQWQPLAEIAKVLHDKKLIAKSSPSTKLFRQFPTHFEMMPAGKPNRVRFLNP